MRNTFLHPTCSPRTLDVYVARKSILTALKTALPQMSGVLLDVGCGKSPYKPIILSPQSKVSRYIGLDIQTESYGTPDLIWEGQNIPLANCSVETCIATEVLEHCPEPVMLMQEINRVLKQQGVFFATVPFLWPLHDVPHDHWRFTPWSLESILRQAGFEDIRITALGGPDAALAQMLGLWTRRRSRSRLYSRLIRPLLSLVAAPLVWLLAGQDKPVPALREGLMITGLSVIATKSAKS